MKRIMYREAVASALAEEMRRDEKVFVMGEDVAITGGVYKATRGLLDEFGPKRVRNTPLSELSMPGYCHRRCHVRCPACGRDYARGLFWLRL